MTRLLLLVLLLTLPARAEEHWFVQQGRLARFDPHRLEARMAEEVNRSLGTDVLSEPLPLLGPSSLRLHPLASRQRHYLLLDRQAPERSRILALGPVQLQIGSQAIGVGEEGLRVAELAGGTSELLPARLLEVPARVRAEVAEVGDPARWFMGRGGFLGGRGYFEVVYRWADHDGRFDPRPLHSRLLVLHPGQGTSGIVSDFNLPALACWQPDEHTLAFAGEGFVRTWDGNEVRTTTSVDRTRGYGAPFEAFPLPAPVGRLRFVLSCLDFEERDHALLVESGAGQGARVLADVRLDDLAWAGGSGDRVLLLAGGRMLECSRDGSRREEVGPPEEDALTVDPVLSMPEGLLARIEDRLYFYSLEARGWKAVPVR